MYLGYKWKTEFSELISSLTLILGEKVKANFFEPIEVNNHYLQGFCVTYSTYLGSDKISLIDNLLKELKLNNIFRNKESEYEVLFVICSDKSVMQSFYDKRYEQKVATKVCEGFNYFYDIEVSQEEINKFREEVEASTPRLFV
jgi:regulator of sigma D